MGIVRQPLFVLFDTGRLFYHVQPSATYFLAFAPKSRQKRRLRGWPPLRTPLVRDGTLRRVLVVRLYTLDCSPETVMTGAAAHRLRLPSYG